MSEPVEQNIKEEITPVESKPVESKRGIELPPPGKPLGQQLALELLCRAVHLAQSRGAYKLEEASVFLRAINEFTIKN